MPSLPILMRSSVELAADTGELAEFDIEAKTVITDKPREELYTPQKP